MQASGIGLRYARALIELGQETGTTAKMLTELGHFIDAYKGSHELRQALGNPAISADERKALVRQLGTRMALSKLVVNFLQLLVDKDRGQAIPAIFEAYQGLADAKAGNMRAQVTSAQALNPGQLARLKATLGKMTGNTVIVETEVDPALIGGVVTRIDGKVYDGSLRTQLESLQQRATQSA